MATKAAVAQPASSVATELLRNLESATTTTSQSLRDLRALLGLSTEDAKANVSAVNPRAPRKATISKTKTVQPRSVARKPAKTEFEILAEPDTPVLKLPDGKRRKIAAETFNVGLKTLSVAAKAVQKEREQKLKQEVQGLTLSPTKATPLQPCSPNRQSKKGKTNTVPEDGDIKLVAECACTALDCLRQSSASAKADDISRQEQGALILLDKIITLGLTELALREATRTYEQYWKRQKNSSHPLGDKPRTQDTNLASLLVFVPKPDVTTDFAFISSFQSQILRLSILKGACSLTEEFVAALSLTTKGSPPSHILLGLEQGWINEARAGEQIRTISQAMMKLLSPFQKTSNNKILLDLTVEAMILRIRSWKLLDHTPDLDRELWTTFVQILKSLWPKQAKESGAKYELSKEACTKLQGVLQASGLEHEVPHHLRRFFIDLAERNGKFDDAVQLQIASPADTATDAAFISKWRIATSELSKSQLDNINLSNVQHALQTFTDVNITSKIFNDILVYGVRLRKACSTVISIIEGRSADERAMERSTSLQTCALRILFAFTKLLANDFLALTSSTHAATNNNKAPEDTSISTLLLKTIESALEAEKCNFSRNGPLREECDEALRNCSALVYVSVDTTAHETMTLPFRSHFEKVSIRLSNVFWMRHVQAGLSDGLDDKALKLLESSVNILVWLPIEQKQHSALGVKLEKLARLHEQARDFVSAVKTEEQATVHFIDAGALVDAVKTSLTSRAACIWTDEKTLAAQLGRILCSRMKLIAFHDLCNGQNCWFYDSEELPPLQRCALLDVQLQSLFKIRASKAAASEIRRVTSLILDLSSENQYRVLRLRYISNLLQLVVKSEVLAVSDIFTDKLIDEACGHQDSKADYALKSFEPVLKSLVQLQWALVVGREKIDALQTFINPLVDEILLVTDLTNFETRVDDRCLLTNILEAALDVCNMKEHEEGRMSTLKALVHITRVSKNDSSHAMVSYLSRLALLQIRQDKTVAAGKCLAEAEQISNTPTTAQAQLELACTKVEYHLSISNHDKCPEIFDLAFKKLESGSAGNRTTQVNNRLDVRSLQAWASLLCSSIAYRQGDLGNASRLARQAVKLTSSTWSALDSAQKKLLAEGESGGSGIAQEMSNLSLNNAFADRPNVPQGAKYWKYADLHLRALSNMAIVSAHHGLYSDAQFYQDQVVKIAQSLSLDIWEIRAKSALALLITRAGQREAATALLGSSIASQLALNASQNAMTLLDRAEALIELGDIKAAESCLARIEKQGPVLQESQGLCDRKAPQSTSKARRTGPKSSTLHASARRPASKTTTTTARQPTQKTKETIFLTVQQIEVEDRRSALYATLCLHSKTKSNSRGLKAQTEPSKSDHICPTHVVQGQITTTITLLAEALVQLSANSVTSVLSETAVALPVKYRSSRKSGRVSMVQSGASPVKRNSVKARGTAQDTSTAIAAAQKLLEETHRIIFLIRRSKMSFCSSVMVHLLHRLQSKVALLSSTMKMPFSYSSLQLVLQSFEPKDVARERERLAIVAETTSRDRLYFPGWPTVTELSPPQPTVASPESQKMLERIPPNWSIISIALADNEQELIVSKTVKSRSPFLLRIPLARSDDIDVSDDFNFAEAKAEMLEIIRKADRSTHDKRGQADKDTRRTWYAEREALDNQIETWLNNVENIWLGGFRGLMTPCRFDDAAISRFGQSLVQILEKHLPSRQKTGNRDFERVELHAHVLELFLGLGCPQSQNLDDAVIDLLNFVVDIFQFSGEHNAYDEIDWDAMLVEVLDVLTACHVKVSSEERNTQHTILILDKELERFPWESLPCLRGQPVSRMPSLGAVLERLDRFTADPTEAEAYTIPRNGKGAYILNPSSDLASTQSTFEPLFQTYLPEYTALVNTPPSEDHFASLLTSNELLLYFGHGSGAQYIRGRTIRKLERCAVAFLMGCSSAKMTECGKFESYGMPGYYSLGGSMAVVGTLWDVTDRDIDRFALRTLVNWGLLPEDDEKVQEGLARTVKKSPSSSKGKGKAPTKPSKNVKHGSEGRSGKIALDEAVMTGRDACLLKYLNGAAPVVYGLPVYLE